MTFNDPDFFFQKPLGKFLAHYSKELSRKKKEIVRAVFDKNFNELTGLIFIGPLTRSWFQK